MSFFPRKIHCTWFNKRTTLLLCRADEQKGYFSACWLFLSSARSEIPRDKFRTIFIQLNLNRSSILLRNYPPFFPSIDCNKQRSPFRSRPHPVLSLTFPVSTFTPLDLFSSLFLSLLHTGICTQRCSFTSLPLPPFFSLLLLRLACLPPVLSPVDQTRHNGAHCERTCKNIASLVVKNTPLFIAFPTSNFRGTCARMRTRTWVCV